jgi:hypothetical protein
MFANRSRHGSLLSKYYSLTDISNTSWEFFYRKIGKRVAELYYYRIIERKVPIQNKKQPKEKIHAAAQLLWGLTIPPPSS